jgi:hypothetical protein
MGNTKIENVKGLNRAELANQWVKFVHQKPGFNLADYGDQASFKQDYRGYKKDADFNRRIPAWEVEGLFNELTDEELAHRVFDNRLMVNENKELEYITGQYYPVEYQWAAKEVYEKARRIVILKEEGKW